MIRQALLVGAVLLAGCGSGGSPGTSVAGHIDLTGIITTTGSQVADPGTSCDKPVGSDLPITTVFFVGQDGNRYTLTVKAAHGTTNPPVQGVSVTLQQVGGQNLLADTLNSGGTIVIAQDGRSGSVNVTVHPLFHDNLQIEGGWTCP